MLWLCFNYEFSASLRAHASWSGHDVGLAPQRMPLSRVIASSAFMPRNRAAMPCRLPWQPPTNDTSPIVPSSFISKFMSRLHVPTG